LTLTQPGHKIPAGARVVLKEKTKEEKDNASLAVISEGAAMDGVLRSTAVIHLCGTFHGLIIAENELIIAPGGTVRANVRARKAVIAGDFQGEMAVQEDVEITETGRFAGTLYQQTPSLVLAKGGRFDGRSIFVDNMDAVVANWESHGSSLPQDDQAPARPKDVKAKDHSDLKMT